MSESKTSLMSESFSVLAACFDVLASVASDTEYSLGGGNLHCGKVNHHKHTQNMFM